jgi:putative transposase
MDIEIKHAATNWARSHRERNHHGLENRLLKPIYQVRGLNGVIKKRERLGGMLNYYYRLAA